jgi:uncharacterized protein (TIGR02270 family)
VTRTAQAKFADSLYSEHIEWVSFLYGQRQKLALNPEISWQKIGNFEARLETHLEALLAGGEAALDFCRRKAQEGDAGELHAALRIICRQGRKDLFVELLEHQDPEDKEKLAALIDALKYDFPASWQNDLVALLLTDDAQFCELIAEVVAFRRIPCGVTLVQALRSFQPTALLRVAGRLRERNALSLVRQALKHEDEIICSEAALTLLRLGDCESLDQVRAKTDDKDWAGILLALGGNRLDLNALQNRARLPEATPDRFLALALFGEIGAVSLLLERLAGASAEAAALSLNILTGADLYQRVFIPEAVNEDELFPGELEAYQQEGKVPTKPDGTPYGEWVIRLSQDLKAWSDWWSENGRLFQPGVRYRNGKPFLPLCLLESLQCEKTPLRIRQFAYEELVIRYDVDFFFEVDLSVKEQLCILGEMAHWVAANDRHFTPGEWYLAGQLL